MGCTLLLFFPGWHMDMTDRASAAILGHEVALHRRRVKEQQVKRNLAFVTLKPLCALWRIYLWTSVMRKSNIVLSSLSHYCLGCFYSKPKLILTIHSENSFLTKVVPEWDSWRPRAMQPELSRSTPFLAWFSSTFPLILGASRTIPLNSLFCLS